MFCNWNVASEVSGILSNASYFLSSQFYLNNMLAWVSVFFTSTVAVEWEFLFLYFNKAHIMNLISEFINRIATLRHIVPR